MLCDSRSIATAQCMHGHGARPVMHGGVRGTCSLYRPLLMNRATPLLWKTGTTHLMDGSAGSIELDSAVSRPGSLFSEWGFLSSTRPLCARSLLTGRTYGTSDRSRHFEARNMAPARLHYTHHRRPCQLDTAPRRTCVAGSPWHRPPAKAKARTTNVVRP